MNHKIALPTFLLLLLLLLDVSKSRAEGFFEIRGGLGWFGNQTRAELLNGLGDPAGTVNRYDILGVPSFDILVGWETEPLLSVVRINVSLSGTNTVFLDNGTEPDVTNPRYGTLHSSKFRTKNYGISFSEYLPFGLFGDKLTLSPCFELKLGHYLDPSAGQEFVLQNVKPASDHWFGFLKLGLKAQVDLGQWSIFAEYKYPVFGLLTDGFTGDNRREDTLWTGVTWNLEKAYFSAGYEGSTFLFSNSVMNSLGESYVKKTFATIVLVVGVKF